MASIEIGAGGERKKKLLLSSEVGEKEANLGHLSGETLKTIVEHVPKESLEKMKMLSKGWNCLISDVLQSNPSSTSTIREIGTSSDIHSVEEAKRIRSRAILENFLPTRVFNEFKESKESLGAGLCQWCLQKYNHKSKSECPAGDLEFYTREQCTRYVVPVFRPRIKENALKASIQIYLPDETKEDDVRKLLEPFGPLRRVMLRRLRHEDFATCFATVSFVDIDDAERALVKLKEDGLSVNWVV